MNTFAVNFMLDSPCKRGYMFVMNADNIQQIDDYNLVIDGRIHIRVYDKILYTEQRTNLKEPKNGKNRIQKSKTRAKKKNVVVAV